MNAKKEFQRETGDKQLVAAQVEIVCVVGQLDKEMCLYPGYTAEELSEFLAALDFEYDNGYGMQHILGRIWYADGTWSTRHEYDGSEWWTHHVRPPLPCRD